MSMWRIKVFDDHGQCMSVEGTKEAMFAAYDALKEAIESPDGTAPTTMEFKGCWGDDEHSTPRTMRMLVRPEHVSGVYLIEF